jgi:hypothetical protein
MDEDDAVALEITGELDLHTFSPKDVSALVPVRRMVHAALDRHPKVVSYRLGDQRSGSWGATLVVLDVQAG